MTTTTLPVRRPQATDDTHAELAVDLAPAALGDLLDWLATPAS